MKIIDRSLVENLEDAIKNKLPEAIDLVREMTKEKLEEKVLYEEYGMQVSLLNLAIHYYLSDIAEEIVKKGVSIEEGNSRMPPLINAASKGLIRVVDEILKQGIDVNTAYFGSTALSSAVMGGHGNLVQMLLGRGANIEVRDEAGRTPLHTAVLNHEEVVRILLDKGADVHATIGNTFNVLHQAAWHPSPNSGKIIDMLVAAGVSVNAIDNSDKGNVTALDIAEARRQVYIQHADERERKGDADGAVCWYNKVRESEEMINLLKDLGGLHAAELLSQANIEEQRGEEALVEPESQQDSSADERMEEMALTSGLGDREVSGADTFGNDEA